LLRAGAFGVEPPPTRRRLFRGDDDSRTSPAPGSTIRGVG